MQGRFVRLRPIQESDLKTLHSWRNDPSFLSHCSIRQDHLGLEDFGRELKNDFERDRHKQYMIMAKDVPIGSIFTYNYSKKNQHVFLTIFLDPKYQDRIYGVEAVALLLYYLFNVVGVFKVYLDVYEFNKRSKSILDKTGFALEGRFKGHTFRDGVRYDLLRYAIFRTDLERIRSFLFRLTKV